MVFHDAYGHFESRFGMHNVVAITINPAIATSVKRLRAVRERIRQEEAVCVFSEPQFDSRLVNTAVEGTDARTGLLDPLGTNLEPGPSLYVAFLQQVATQMKDCLSAQ